MASVILNTNQKKKKASGLCIVSYCRKPHGKQKNKCYRCIKREFRDRNPERAAYDDLKSNAKRRNKEFKLSFEEYLQLLDINPEHMKNRGKTANSSSWDRDDNKRGYEKDNMKSMPLKNNSYKRNHIDYQTTDPTAENYCGF